MESQIANERELVISAIRDANSSKFTVLTNLEKEEHYVVQMFPDIILVDKTTNKPVFIIEIKRNGNIAQCIQQWKNVPNIPSTLYILVPTSDLTNAKSILQVVGLNARVGSYSVDENKKVTVKYE